MLDAQDGRLLEYPGAQAVGRAGLTDAEIQRMQVAVIVIDQAACVRAGSQHFAGFRAIPEFPGVRKA